MVERDRSKRRYERKSRTSNSTPKSTPFTPDNSTSSTGLNFPKIDLSQPQNPQSQTHINSAITFDTSNYTGVFQIPGVPTLDYQTIGSQVRFGDFETVEDIKNPQLKNKATDSEKERAITEYQQGINYFEIEKKYGQWLAKQFESWQEKLKAYKSGINTLTEYENVKQAFLGFLKAKDVTDQKLIDYVVNAHRTGIARAKAPYQIAEQELDLGKTKTKAEKAFVTAQKEINELASLKQQILGDKPQQ